MLNKDKNSIVFMTVLLSTTLILLYQQFGSALTIHTAKGEQHIPHGQQFRNKLFQEQQSGRKPLSAEQQARLDHLDEYCQKRSRSFHPVHSLQNFFVDDKHKVLYCSIPKAGCSAWKWNLIVMNANNASIQLEAQVHNKSFLESHGIRRLNTYTNAEIAARILQYYKFTFVRHPMSRLVSGYKNKFIKDNNGYFHKKYGPMILRHAKKKVPKNYTVTFPDFLSYLGEPENRLQYDEHFRSYEVLCSPCALRFDFIGKQETFDEDSNYLFDNVFRRRLKTPDSPRSTNTDRDATFRAFQKVPEHVKKIAIEKHSNESAMFGYDLHGYI